MEQEEMQNMVGKRYVYQGRERDDFNKTVVVESLKDYKEQVCFFVSSEDETLSGLWPVKNFVKVFVLLEEKKEKAVKGMEKVTMGVVSCKRCGHGWVPRIENIRVCPKCKSPYWNKERREKRGDTK